MSGISVFNNAKDQKCLYEGWKVCENGGLQFDQKVQQSVINMLNAVRMLGDKFSLNTNISFNKENYTIILGNKTWIDIAYDDKKIEHFDVYSSEDGCMFYDVDRWKNYFVDSIYNKIKADQKSFNKYRKDAEERANNHDEYAKEVFAHLSMS